jgi:hydroxymethylbilane synthase
MKQVLKIGTRGSALALKQTSMVEEALKKAHPGLEIERVIIRTSGDWKPEDGEKPLSEQEGGKGLFAREIEQAMLRGEIDCAVHSMKDMESFLPAGLALDHVLERADPRDAFLSLKAQSFMDLPQGATVGTSSQRRKAFLLNKRPDLKVVPLRGNVDTRIRKLKDGQVDATFLAMAGLTRLGIKEEFIYPMEEKEMLPACGQGIVCIETKTDDAETRALLDSIHHAETGFRGKAERAALQVLDGSCHTPIGCHARMAGDAMRVELAVASMDGKHIYETFQEDPVGTDEEAAALGQSVATRLKQRLPAGILA